MLPGPRERFVAAVLAAVASAPLVMGVVVWVREALAGTKGQTELTA